MPGDPGQNLLLTMARSAPMFGNVAPPSYVPDFNPGFLGGNPLLAMGANALLGNFFAGQGYLPARFSPGVNFADQQFAKDYFLQHQQALATAAAADRAADVERIRGMFLAAGRPFDAQARQFAGTLAGGIEAAAPILAQIAPDFLDATGGRQGRAVVLADALHRGGRTAVDPITGRTGFSGQTAGALAAEVGRRLVGPGGDPTAFRGLSQGQVGLLYEELQARGLVGAAAAAPPAAAIAADRGLVERALSASLSTNPGLVRRLVDAQARRGDRAIGGLLEHEQVAALAANPQSALAAVEAIRRESPAGEAELLRDADARRISKRLKSLSGAVQAMKDIFGDAGHPDAPMQQVVQKLDDLTQGGLAAMDPARLERLVRLTQATARNTGLGIDAVTGLAAQIAGTSDAIGLSRRFALPLAVSAGQFGRAWGDAPQAGTPSFFDMTQERATLLDAQLRARASASGLANQLGVVARIDDITRLRGPARALADAIKAGRTTFGPNNRSVFLSEAEFRATMRASGVDEATLQQFSTQRGANQEAIEKYGLGDLVRDNAQAADIRGFLAQSQRGSFAALGLNDRQAARAAQAATATLMTMDEQARRDAGKRDAAVAAAVRRALGGARGISEDQLRRAAESGFGAFNEFVRRDPRLQGYETGLNAIEMQDPRQAQRRRRVEEEARASAEIHSALAGVGQAGVVQRLADVLRDPNVKGFGDVAAQALGGVKPDQVRAAIAGLKGLSDQELAKRGIRDRKVLDAMAAGVLAQAEAAEAAAKGAPDAAAKLKAAQEASKNLPVPAAAGGAAPAAPAPGQGQGVGQALGTVARAALSAFAGGPAAAGAAAGGTFNMTGTLVLQGLDQVLLKNARAVPAGAGSTPVQGVGGPQP
jgi:hypothetical protein